jgi:hypothetical protein
MNHPMELNIWRGDWGLPSVDLHCLEIMVGVSLSLLLEEKYFADLNVYRSPM